MKVIESMKSMKKSRVAKFFQSKNKVEYKSGETIIRAGDVPIWIYWVEKGFVRQYALSDEGEELTLYLYGMGGIFFLPFLYGMNQVQHNFEAVTDAVVWRMKIEEFGAMLHEYPVLSIELMMGGLVGLSLLMLHMESMVFGNACRKMASVLTILVLFFGKKRNNGNGSLRIMMPMTHRLLGTMVGMSRETVTMELGKLKKTGILRQKGRWLEVVDLEGLKKIACLELNYVPKLPGFYGGVVKV